MPRETGENMAQSPIPPQSAPPKPTVQTYAARAVPWRGDVLWWVVLTEGVIAFLIGLFIVLNPTQSGDILIRLVGAYVLFESVMAIIRLARGKAEPAAPGRWIRVGVGLVVGIIAFAYPWMTMMTPGSAATVLAIGLMVIGALGIYSIFVTRAAAGWRWGQMIVYGLYLVFAILIFNSNRSDTEPWILPTLGWVILIGGVALIGYGIWLYQKYASAKAAADTAAVLASTPATAGTPATPTSTAMPATAPAPSTTGSTAPAASQTAAPSAPAPSDGNGSSKPTS
jgi:uncharacterized membrane protein HdeD (DUF308 family)